MNTKTPQNFSFMDCMVFFFSRILPKYSLVEEVVKNYSTRLNDIDDKKIRRSYRYLKLKGII
ncbi:MAG: hypothetical protein N2745_00490 [Syntrophorhabdaceae bacterium]|nr:hypothetical protein [Syntrophorhabdaceae bacterium]